MKIGHPLPPWLAKAALVAVIATIAYWGYRIGDASGAFDPGVDAHCCGAPGN